MGDNSGYTAWVFPGQGSQTVGMGKALFDRLPVVRDLYQGADKILGYSLSEICFEGPAEALQRTDRAQPALLVTGLAHLSALRHEFPGEYETARFAAGHSLGEYTALVAAGALTLEGGLRLVAERGRLMHAAGGAGESATGMSAVIGMPDEAVAEVCEEADVDLANINAPGQIVISGPLLALEKAAESARARGARRIVPLPVSAAFHSRWMRPMAETFARAIAQAWICDPGIEVIANVTARPVSSAKGICDLLEQQTYSPVRWVESVQFMADQGVTRFVEIGPGKVLSGLVKRIAPGAEIITSEDLLGL